MKTTVFSLILLMILAGCGDKSEQSSSDSDIVGVDAYLVDTVNGEGDSDLSEQSDEKPDTFDESEMSDEVADESVDLSDEASDVKADESLDEVADETEDEVDDSDQSDEESDQSDDSEMPDDDIDNGPDVPLAGFGAISGECGFLNTELTDAGSHYFKNNIDFTTDPYDSEDYQYLTAGGKEIYDDGNLGGSSIYSEMFSYEVLYRCELATLLKTEAEIIYQNTSGKKTDFLAEIDGVKIGVSVTRALKYPFDAEYTVTDAENLLSDKLSDILLSSANAAPEDSWEKQILHVIAYSNQHAQSLLTAYGSLDSAVKADTVVIVTVSDGDDAFLY
jgi:hypothetical protein